MFNGAPALFEAAKREDTVQIIATTGEKIITLYQTQPGKGWYYSFPGGRMDVAGERPRATAIRELLEETGYKSSKWLLWKQMSGGGGSKMVHNNYIFLAKDCHKIQNPQPDNGEKIKVRLYSFEPFLKLTDRADCQFWPPALKIELLLARIHPKRKKVLKKTIFG